MEKNKKLIFYLLLLSEYICEYLWLNSSVSENSYN